MSAQENKILSNRVAQAISEGDLEALDELMAPELADEFKRDVAEIRRAFPDYAGTNVEQIAEGEEVANRFVFLGTHLGEFEGVNPTGKRVEFVGHSIDRVVEGKIVESWVEVDMLGVIAAARSGTRTGTIHFAVIDYSLRLRLLAGLSVRA